MPQKSFDGIILERQASSISTISSAAADVTKDKRESASPSKNNAPTPASLRTLVLSVIVYYVGIYHTKFFIPNHDAVFTRQHPMFQTKSGDVILNFDLNQPLIYPASVPSKVLFRTCVHLPLIFLCLVYFRKSWNCVLASASGLLTAIGICEVCTHVAKYYVMRRRPNFYSLCGWDSAVAACTAAPKKILESQLSFPSGHSSMSWCGMTFVVLILVGKLRLSESRHWERKRWILWLIVLVPWSWAGYVATSRIADYWHHASDVIAGILLGVLCAILSYHTVFPHILSLDAGVSFAELNLRKNY